MGRAFLSDPEYAGRALGEFAADEGFDGVDFDIELTEKDQKNLANFITCHRSLYPDHPDDEDRSLHRDEWQPYFIGECPTEFIDARKKAFQRARAALVRKGELVQSNNVYTWTGSGQTSDMSDDHHEADRTDTDTRL